MDKQQLHSIMTGMPLPDLVFYLKISLEKIHQRADFGSERFDSLEFQEKVIQEYNKIKTNNMKIIDCDNLSLEECAQCVLQTVLKKINLNE